MAENPARCASMAEAMPVGPAPITRTSKELVGSMDLSRNDLYEIGRLKLSPCTVADVQHFNLLLFLQNSEYHAVNMRLVAVEQVSQLVPFARNSAAVRPFFQAQDGLFETPVPVQSSIGILGIDPSVETGKVTLSAGCDVNE